MTLSHNKPTLHNRTTDRQADDRKEQRRHNSTYPKDGVSCSKNSFVVIGSLVFQIKFCGKSPAHRVAANRYLSGQRIARIPTLWKGEDPPRRTCLPPKLSSLKF